MLFRKGLYHSLSLSHSSYHYHFSQHFSSCLPELPSLCAPPACWLFLNSRRFSEQRNTNPNNTSCTRSILSFSPSLLFSGKSEWYFSREKRGVLRTTDAQEDYQCARKDWKVLAECTIKWAQRPSRSYRSESSTHRGSEMLHLQRDRLMVILLL